MPTLYSWKASKKEEFKIKYKNDILKKKSLRHVYSKQKNVAERNQDPNTCRHTPWSCIKGLSSIKVGLLSKLIYTFHLIPIFIYN